MARRIKITPPEISSMREGNFLKQFPDQKPQMDIKNDAAPIIIDGRRSLVPLKLRLTPAASASILVAKPIEIRHLKPIQQIVSSFFSKASAINLIPSTRKIAKTSQ